MFSTITVTNTHLFLGTRTVVDKDEELDVDSDEVGWAWVMVGWSLLSSLLVTSPIVRLGPSIELTPEGVERGVEGTCWD